MATPAGIRSFVESTRPRDWYGQCAGLTYRTIADNGGHAPDIYSSAFASYRAATIESKNPALAPPGAIHYWDYTGTDDRGIVNRWGHVAVDIHGGGLHVLSATGHAHEWWGVRAGLITVAAQSARGMPYLGWSRFYGRRNRIEINTGAPAGGGSRPFEPEEEDMPLNPESDYPAFAQMLQRALRYDVRPDGVGATGALGQTIFEQLARAAGKPDASAVATAVWNHPIQAQDANGVPQRRPDGTPVTFTAAGYPASTNAQVAALREALKTLAVGQGLDPQAIEDAAMRGAEAALERLTLVPKVE